MPQPTDDIVVIAQNDVTLPQAGTDNRRYPREEIIDRGYDTQGFPCDEYNYITHNHGQWLSYLWEEFLPTLGQDKADKATTLTAGDGLTGGGDLSEDRVFSLGAPSTISVTSTDSVSDTSHEHALDLSGRSVNAGNGLTGGGNLNSDVTTTLGTPSTISVTSTNAVSADSHEHVLDLSGRSITTSGGLTGGGDLGSDLDISIDSVSDNVAILAGILNDGGTIPLPSGFTRSDCAAIASCRTMDKGSNNDLDGFVCNVDQPSGSVQVHANGSPNIPGVANYLIVGVL